MWDSIRGTDRIVWVTTDSRICLKKGSHQRTQDLLTMLAYSYLHSVRLYRKHDRITAWFVHSYDS